MEPLRVEMAPTSMAVDFTPGAVPVFCGADEVVGATDVDVVDGEDEHPATAMAIPSANAPGTTRIPRCSPMAVLSPGNGCSRHHIRHSRTTLSVILPGRREARGPRGTHLPYALPVPAMDPKWCGVCGHPGSHAPGDRSGSGTGRYCDECDHCWADRQNNDRPPHHT